MSVLLVALFFGFGTWAVFASTQAADEARGDRWRVKGGRAAHVVLGFSVFLVVLVLGALRALLFH